MGLDKQAGVSILELVLYTPCLPIAVLVCTRHGFRKSSGFVFTLVLCLIRLVGACCQLASTSSPSIGLFEAVFILQSLGLSQLLLATLGLLSRCLAALSLSAVIKPFRLLHLLVIAGAVLGIVGGTNSITPTGTYTPQTSSKVGILLFLAAFAGAAPLSLLCLARLTASAGGDPAARAFAVATTVAVPFVGVRVVYSVLAVWTRIEVFAVTGTSTGAVLVRVFMGVLMEFVVVVVYLVVGWNTEGAEKVETKGQGHQKRRRHKHRHRRSESRDLVEEQEVGVEREEYGNHRGIPMGRM